MEMWINLRFQPRFHNLLRDSIRHSGNAQTSFSATLFRYLYCPDWRWKVAARRHSIPDSVEILLHSLFKILNRLTIDACRSLVRLHSLIRFPDLFLRNTNGFASFIGLLPLLVGSSNQAPRHSALAPSLYGGLLRYYTLSRPCDHASVRSPSWVRHLWLLR